jgi:hypothetical protein
MISCAAVMALFTCCFVWVGAAQEPIDMTKLRALHERVLKSEKLSADEQTYYERGRQEFLRKQQQAKGDAAKKAPSLPVLVPPNTDSTGLVPLTDLGSGTYKGEDGGLYGGGRNEPPAGHRAAVEAELKSVQPLDFDGRPAADGKIVFISIGMSNTTQEFSAFKKLADADPRKSPRVVIVDCAQGGRVASVWANDGEGNLGPDPWPVLDQRLKDAGVSPRQVQVAWIKHAQNMPHTVNPFPAMIHAQTLAGNIIFTLQRLHLRFPNLKVAYLSSRIYAGYATTPLNPEPYAYESAFANRWVIQRQIKGDPLLNFDPAKGPVMTPVVVWGPYLWADGVKPRQSDQFVWLPDDLGADGTHPSLSGQAKVANLLLDFMRENPLASTWYLGKRSDSAR